MTPIVRAAWSLKPRSPTECAGKLLSFIRETISMLVPWLPGALRHLPLLRPQHLQRPLGAWEQEMHCHQASWWPCLALPSLLLHASSDSADKKAICHGLSLRTELLCFLAGTYWTEIRQTQLAFRVLFGLLFVSGSRQINVCSLGGVSLQNQCQLATTLDVFDLLICSL